MSDQPARDYAVSNFTDTIVVEAGAGTGKTTLLVNRICALIEAGVEIEKIAAVTFTVKASGELKERLRMKLKAAESDNARRAVQNLDRMTVNTIHGLAAELLRTLPVEAKLSPEFLALDDLQQTAAAEEFRTNWLMHALNGHLPHEIELADQIGLDLIGSENKGFAKLFDVLNHSLVDVNRVTTGEANVEQIAALVMESRFQIHRLASLATHCKDEDDKLYTVIRNVARWISECPDSSIVSSAGIDWLKRAEVGNKTLGAKTKWSSLDALSEAKEARAALANTIALMKQAVTSTICNQIVKWILPAVAEFRKHLRDNGAIGFDDLLILCRDMLRDSKTARDYFKTRFDFVHIDEFQDTDPIQVEIAFYLCEAINSHAGKWHDVKLKPGKLFVVGDPKQSIYRFRGADVRIYNRVAQMIEAVGKKLTIARNFRSRSSILREINAVFEPIMQGSSDDDALYVPLLPSADTKNDPAAVELLQPPEEYDPAVLNAAQSSAHEAAAIADHISHLKLKNKSFKYSQAAILLRTGTRVAELQHALSARGIPFVSFMNSAFTSRVEIEAMITLLSAIANPQHTVAVIGALRSPFFAISDDELYVHKLAGRGFVYTDGVLADSMVSTALATLHKWNVRSKRCAPSELIEELLSALPIDILYGLKSEGVQRVQNVQTFVDLVRRLEQGGVSTLDAIINRVSDMKRLVQSTELEARDESRDAVQVLTLHKSKGLEFNYVYLYNYREQVRSIGEWLLRKSIDDKPHLLAVCADKENGFCTQSWEMVKAGNDSAENAEMQRLLYVGMTRAKDKLVLPYGWSRVGAKKREPAIPLALLQRYPIDIKRHPIVANTEAIATISNASLKSDFKPLASAHPSQHDESGLCASRFSIWKENLESRTGVLKVAVTREEAEGEVEWQRVRARKIGTYIHAVLEHSAKGKTIAVAEQLAARGISLTDDEKREAEEILKVVLQSPLFSVELPTARRIITELPIVANNESYVAAKFVDLMFESQDGRWILVDYKTDQIAEDAVHSRKEDHRKQLEQYGKMFERVMGVVPSESRLYFVRPNRMITL